MKIHSSLLAVFSVIVLIYSLGNASDWSTTKTKPTTLSPEAGRILGRTIQVIDNVDHAIEHYRGIPGLFTLDDQLKALGVEVDAVDHITAIPDPTLGIGSLIEIIRATTVTVIDAGKSRTYKTWQPTVGTLLTEQRINLGDHDRVAPELATSLGDRLEISITRVSISEETQTESINFKNIVEKDDTLEKGHKITKQKGEKGIRTKTFSITRENGQEVSRILISNEVTKQPIDQIIIEGTKVISLGSGQATWYRWREGQAAHNSLPKGTKVRVVNPANGKSTVVIITDRGIQGSAIIDLDYRNFALLAPLSSGRIQVHLEKVYSD